MYPLIDKDATGKQIKRIMDYRGITVKQIQEARCDAQQLRLLAYYRKMYVA